MVTGLTPSRADNARTEGNATPGASSPERIARAYDSAICTRTGVAADRSICTITEIIQNTYFLALLYYNIVRYRCFYQEPRRDLPLRRTHAHHETLDDPGNAQDDRAPRCDLIRRRIAGTGTVSSRRHPHGGRTCAGRKRCKSVPVWRHAGHRAAARADCAGNGSPRYSLHRRRRPDHHRFTTRARPARQDFHRCWRCHSHRKPDLSRRHPVVSVLSGPFSGRADRQ